ncbi:PREDICTED: L-type lectin-domain containing receptor kinase IX.1-like [Fragaria vesca subsp. vesca]
MNFLSRSVHPISFDIYQFNPDTENLIYEGDAKPMSGNVQLTSLLGTYLVGWCTYAKPLHLWDSATRSLVDFKTHFTFTIDTGDKNSFSDGFAFFLAPFGCPVPANSAGAFLGLFNRDTCFDEQSENQILVVEFDTYPDRWDPHEPHVGININKITSAVTARWNFSSKQSGKVANAMITYNATTKDLQVFWTYEEDVVFDHSLSLHIDLRNVLPEWVTIGFSAATGETVETHVIHSWHFFSSPVPDEKSSYRIMKYSQRRKVILMARLAAVPLLILMLGVALCYWLVVNKNRKASTYGQDLNHSKTVTSINKDLERRAFPRQFTYQELLAATKGFADEARLGQGGSGEVYKGIIQDLCCAVAVKRIFADSDWYEKIFTNEVQIISRVIHRNVVQFIGWCYDQSECLLVYAYMPNGSLDTHLFGSRKPTLPWHIRYKIALGLATALHYLHEEAEQCILHRDVKSANVLLDNDFNTKLGDFGIAKFVDSQLNTPIKGVAGTLGYMAPEYANHGRVSKESDIFSFGVVALEIACGRRTYRNGKYHLPLFGWVWQSYGEGKLLDVADEKLEMDYDRKEMECLLIVGLWCTNPNDKERPKAGQVMKILQLEAPLPELPDDMHGQPLPQDLQQLAGLDSHVSLTSSLNTVGR